MRTIAPIITIRTDRVSSLTDFGPNLPDRFRAAMRCDILRRWMLKYHVIGRWKRDQIATRWSASSFRSTPQLDAQIETAWRAAKSRLGDRLFDGPMCRLESWRVDGGLLQIALSLTCYRIFVGTNMTQPTLPREQLAHTVGVSTLLITADGYAMMGRRSGNVAYYPHRVHPFAGSLEPDTNDCAPDLFDNAIRELHEELGLSAHDISELACLGIVEDTQLSHPEAIFVAHASRTKHEVESNLLGDEHDSAWNCPATIDAINHELIDQSHFTPVAIAALTLLRDSL